jgi:hypothetical protein
LQAVLEETATTVLRNARHHAGCVDMETPFLRRLGTSSCIVRLLIATSAYLTLYYILYAVLKILYWGQPTTSGGSGWPEALILDWRLGYSPLHTLSYLAFAGYRRSALIRSLVVTSVISFLMMGPVRAYLRASAPTFHELIARFVEDAPYVLWFRGFPSARLVWETGIYDVLPITLCVVLILLLGTPGIRRPLVPLLGGFVVTFLTEMVLHPAKFYYIESKLGFSNNGPMSPFAESASIAMDTVLLWPTLWAVHHFGRVGEGENRRSNAGEPVT